MEPSEKFERILRILKVNLKFINQDIFDGNYRRGIRYYSLLCVYLILLFNYAYTFGFFEQTVSQVLMSAGYFLGHAQVHNFGYISRKLWLSIDEYFDYNYHLTQFADCNEIFVSKQNEIVD